MEYWEGYNCVFTAEFVYSFCNEEHSNWYEFYSHEHDFYKAVEKAKRYYDSLMNEKYNGCGAYYNIIRMEHCDT